MKAYSGAILKRKGAEGHRVVTTRRNYQATNPEHARILLEGGLPGRPVVVMTTSLTEGRLGPDVYESLRDQVLEALESEGFTEIDPNGLAMTGVNVRRGDAYESYLLAVAPVER